MDTNVVECDTPERDLGLCSCRSARGLDILDDVHRAYQEKLDALEKMKGAKKVELQVELLTAWVSDLVAQNTLLARAVQDLEVEATTRLVLERKKHAEPGLSETEDTMSDLKKVVDVLQNDNIHKDRELKKLNKTVQDYKKSTASLKTELSMLKCTCEVSKHDAETMAELTYNKESGDGPVKERALLVKYQDTIKDLEASRHDIAQLHNANSLLAKELKSLSATCKVLKEHCLMMKSQADFKDEIIREMRRQLAQAKSKLGKLTHENSHRSRDHHSGDHGMDTTRSPRSYESLSIICVRQPRPRKIREFPQAHAPSQAHTEVQPTYRLEGPPSDQKDGSEDQSPRLNSSFPG